MKHSGKVTNNINDTENKAVLGAHGEVGAVGITRDGRNRRSGGKEFVHFLGTSNLFAGSIHSENEGLEFVLNTLSSHK